MGASCVIRCHTWVLLVLLGVIHGCFLCYEVSIMGVSCVMRCHRWCWLASGMYIILWRKKDGLHTWGTCNSNDSNEYR